MNKRQYKKRVERIKLFCASNFMNSNKCQYCKYYETGDSDVGIFSGCAHDTMWDEYGNFLPKQQEKMDEYSQYFGHLCPYFQANQNVKYKALLPKSYKAYKNAINDELKLVNFLLKIDEHDRFLEQAITYYN